ncbi:unnamed protein product [Zymoseptoria tritici ST99CH_3D7]|uniref:thioredoxin-dependent peroxiredoxin n=1 Tax=Zymoseptoria tritici (strain ST99CH_3D7) TaxID=1276538 RepID=A0A1X7S8E1_ZYMT9|nr:unnamed protein product [Zymoseptoria tritici ST99CH_3D7]
MVELRKRPAPAAPAPEPKKRAPSKPRVPKETSKPAAKAEPTATKAAQEPEKKPSAAAAAKSGPAKVGDTITDLDSFGGDIVTNDGEKTTLAKLLAASKAGVVLFTYPKASTPGCTKQVCFFRDSYDALTSTGLSIYGLSTDSPKSNTTFKTKQNLPYPLLCDPSATLIKAIGLKKAPSGTTRGVFVIDKSGKVLAAEPGGPEPTMQVVKKLVDASGASGGAEKKEDKEKAETAAEVADTAEKVDAA